MFLRAALRVSYDSISREKTTELGRAMGETVAVFTVLNIVYQVNWQVLFGAGGNIASLILLKFGEADKEEVNALMAAGLVLFLLTLVINGIANILVSRLGKTGR